MRRMCYLDDVLVSEQRRQDLCERRHAMDIKDVDKLVPVEGRLGRQLHQRHVHGATVAKDAFGVECKDTTLTAAAVQRCNSLVSEGYVTPPKLQSAAKPGRGLTCVDGVAERKISVRAASRRSGRRLARPPGMSVYAL